MPESAAPSTASPQRPPLPLRPEVEGLEGSKILEVWRLGFGRSDLIPLWVGEGDQPTPDFIGRAAVQALHNGHTTYTHKRGWPDLRAALADYAERHYGVRPVDEAISVTSAGMNAIALIMQAIVRPGDEVVVVSPIWPNAPAAARIAGAQVVPVDLDPLPEGGFNLDMEKLASACTSATRAIFVASPSNPTGWMMEREQQRQLLDLCRARGIWLIADEVYHRFVYDRAVAPSFLAIGEPEDPLFIVHSFSKSWAMTGWRLGWMYHPPSMAPVFEGLIEFSTSGAPNFLQAGALAALREGEAFAAEITASCATGAEIVHGHLAGLPRVTIAKPQASFYAFFAVEGMRDSLAFAKQILNETGVGLAPGSAFGDGGEGFLRLCFASSHERLEMAMQRLQPVLR